MKYILLLPLLVFSLLLFAQENNTENENDTTFFKIGSTKFIIINDSDTSDTKEDDKFKGHFIGLSMGSNSYIIQNTSAIMLYGTITTHVLELNQPRSWEINIDAIQWSGNIYKEHFGVVTGLGFKFNNYRFKNNYYINNNNNILTAFADSSNSITKSKLTISKIRIPLLLEWQNTIGRKKTQVYFSLGGFASYNIHSHMKYNIKDANGKTKDKIYDTFELNPFQYGIMSRFGVGSIHMYVEYNVSEMFNSGKALPINQFTIGMVLINL